MPRQPAKLGSSLLPASQVRFKHNGPTLQSREITTLTACQSSFSLRKSKTEKKFCITAKTERIPAKKLIVFLKELSVIPRWSLIWKQRGIR